MKQINLKNLNLILRPTEKMVNRQLDEEFEDNDNPFRLVIVCAMWITGFDAPGISTIYQTNQLKAIH